MGLQIKLRIHLGGEGFAVAVGEEDGVRNRWLLEAAGVPGDEDAALRRVFNAGDALPTARQFRRERTEGEERQTDGFHSEGKRIIVGGTA